MPDLPPSWHHAPLHLLSVSGAYIVTAGTYNKQHFLNSNRKLKAVHDGLLRYAAKYDWKLEAWVVFSNHYHFVGRSPDNETASGLPKFLGHFHSRSASWLNREDGEPGRKVWHNYWETLIRTQKSYVNRLNYVRENPVLHGLVEHAAEYPWCSATAIEDDGGEEELVSPKDVEGEGEVFDEFRPIWDK